MDNSIHLKAIQQAIEAGEDSGLIEFAFLGYGKLFHLVNEPTPVYMKIQVATNHREALDIKTGISYATFSSHTVCVPVKRIRLDK